MTQADFETESTDFNGEENSEFDLDYSPNTGPEGEYEVRLASVQRKASAKAIDDTPNMSVYEYEIVDNGPYLGWKFNVYVSDAADFMGRKILKAHGIKPQPDGRIKAKPSDIIGTHVMGVFVKELYNDDWTYKLNNFKAI